MSISSLSPKDILVRRWKDCARCTYADTRKNVAVVRGTLPCQVLFVGSSPEKSEDLRGEPFIGKIGSLCAAALGAASSLEDLPIISHAFTHVCACYPGHDAAFSGLPDTNVFACQARFEHVVKVANPKVVVLMGKDASEHYASMFTGCLRMPDAAYIVRKGGVSSPLFHRMVRDLANAMKEVL